MTVVRFVTSHMPYRAGEIASFSESEAKHLCETLKVAVPEDAAGKDAAPSKGEKPAKGEKPSKGAEDGTK